MKVENDVYTIELKINKKDIIKLILSSDDSERDRLIESIRDQLFDNINLLTSEVLTDMRLVNENNVSKSNIINKIRESILDNNIPEGHILTLLKSIVGNEEASIMDMLIFDISQLESLYSSINLYLNKGANND